MSSLHSPRGGSGPAAPLRPLRHIRRRRPFYHCDPAGIKKPQPIRLRYPNLSPTRCPVTPADVALWPAWTEYGPWNLDDFDDDGNPLFEGGY